MVSTKKQLVRDIFLNYFAMVFIFVWKVYSSFLKKQIKKNYWLFKIDSSTLLSIKGVNAECNMWFWSALQPVAEAAESV